jgi:outer membrane receptor for ferrienterochelin and colicins
MIDAGLEVMRERIRSDRVAGERRTQRAAEPFVQHTVNVGPVSIATGARASLSNRWGTAVTPRLALQWRPRPALSVRSGVGAGYRAPDFKELDIEFLNVGPGFGYVVRGNPGLEPEHSRNATLGIEVAPGAWFARVQGFYTTFTDFIETVALPDSGGLQVFSYANRASGRTAGVDAEAAVAWRGFRVEGGYSWLHTRDDETGGALLGRATHSARGAAGWTSPLGLRTRVGAVYSGAAPVRRLDNGTTERRDGFLRVDLRLGWDLPAGIGLTAGVENVFDTRPGEWPGFTGRQVYAGVGWSLARR